MSDERILLTDVVQRLRQLSTICGRDEDVNDLADRVVAHRDRTIPAETVPRAPVEALLAAVANFVSGRGRGGRRALHDAVVEVRRHLAAAPRPDESGDT
jgi:hypothetical protein